MNNKDLACHKKNRPIIEQKITLALTCLQHESRGRPRLRCSCSFQASWGGGVQIPKPKHWSPKCQNDQKFCHRCHLGQVEVGVSGDGGKQLHPGLREVVRLVDARHPEDWAYIGGYIQF